MFFFEFFRKANPKNYFQTTKLKNVDDSEMYFYCLIVVLKKGKVAFHKEIKHYTTCLTVLYLAIATKTVTQTFDIFCITDFIVFFSIPINLFVHPF